MNNSLSNKLAIEREHQDKLSSKQNFSADRFNTDSFYRTRPYSMKKLLDKVNSLKDRDFSTVLDVGSGSGFFSYYFSLKGKVVYALDISYVALQKINTGSYKIHKILSPAEFLPLKDESVDVVWGAAVLHHLDIPIAVREFYRVLRPGGKCFFYEPLGYNPLINLYRKLTPSRRTPTERPLCFDDLHIFHELFSTVEVEFHNFIAALPQALGVIFGFLGLPGKRIYRRIQWLEKPLSYIDSKLLANFPSLQKFCQIVTITARKASKEEIE